MKVTRFEDLVTWQKARLLVSDIYRLTRTRAFARDFALRDQIRKSAISVPSNIAEGFARWRATEFRQFLSIAKGSCAELRTQLYLAFDVGYIDEQTLSEILAKAETLDRMLGKLRARLESRSGPSTEHRAPKPRGESAVH